MHELTHVLQYQRGGLAYIPDSLWQQFLSWVKTGSNDEAYDWRIPDAAGVPWEEWHVEQQAEAVQDYDKQIEAMERHEKVDYDILSRLQKYVDQMKAGPRIAPAAGPAAGAVPQ